MRARLFARYGPEAGLEFELSGEATIGRGKDNTVLLSSPEVSQHHARVFFDADSAAWWIEDLDSLNGTRLDGEPVSGRERLAGLHVLGFGGSAELFFLELEGEAASESGGGEAIEEGTRVDAEAPTLPPGLRVPSSREGTRVDSEVPTLPPGLRAPAGGVTRIEKTPADLPAALAGGAKGGTAARFVLEVVDRPGGRFELGEGDNLVGRSSRAQVVLANRELSRRHATLRVAGGRVWLRDEGSRNHTYVGGEEVADEVEIRPGAELRFGRLRARLVAPGAAPEETG